MILEVTDPGVLLAAGVVGPMLEEIRNGWRYDDEVFALYVAGDPVSIASAHFHRERKNVWTPYVNWVVAWTRPDARRRGHARELSDFLRAEGLARGCVRLRSVVASRLGFEMHRGLGDLFWGASGDTLLVDSPLDGRAFPRTTPASVRRVTSRVDPMSLEQAAAFARAPSRRLGRGLKLDA